jgi:hypothetical protein
VKMYAGRGTGRVCAGCDQSIAPDDVEYEWELTTAPLFDSIVNARASSRRNGTAGRPDGVEGVAVAMVVPRGSKSRSAENRRIP